MPGGKIIWEMGYTLNIEYSIQVNGFPVLLHFLFRSRDKFGRMKRGEEERRRRDSSEEGGRRERRRSEERRERRKKKKKRRSSSSH